MQQEKVETVIGKIKLDLRAKGYDVINLKLLSINEGRVVLRYTFVNTPATEWGSQACVDMGSALTLIEQSLMEQVPEVKKVLINCF